MESNKTYINGEQDRRLKWLEERYSTFNTEMGKVQIDCAIMKADIKWLKRGYWAIFTASIGAVAASVINLLQ